jgi:hypothetical protein
MDRYYDDADPSFGSESSSDDSSSSEGESSSLEDDAEMEFRNEWQRIKDSDPNQSMIEVYGGIENMTEDEWEQFGHDVANNTHLGDLTLSDETLNNQKMTSLFRGLTRSSSIKDVYFMNDDFDVEGVRSMVPFLQNAGNLKRVDVSNNNIGSEGFNLLWRALRDSPIEILHCYNCGIKSIKIDGDTIPKKLTKLVLSENSINTDGCRELTKLLQGGNPTLKNLYLVNNKVDDEGFGILVNALQNNTSLESLWLDRNDPISHEGHVSLLKLVNDVSSIKSTLHSNHTLLTLRIDKYSEEIQEQINAAIRINKSNKGNPDAAGRAKVIHSQLHSVTRAKLAALQGVHRSVYIEIDPLHLPEILSLVDEKHGQRELYVALKSSIVTLFSTVNEKKCIEQEREYHVVRAAEHMAKIEELDAKLAAMEGMQGNDVDGDSERSNKRRRTWFWGLWGG